MGNVYSVSYRSNTKSGEYRYNSIFILRMVRFSFKNMPNNLHIDSWLSYIEQLHPKTIDLGLERVETVAKHLNLLTTNCPVITVAGTNGKGSCVATLSAILSAEGYRVGAYFSPHLERYNERIQIAGEPVSDEVLCTAFTAIDLARQAISLTYFEWGTLAALWLFKQAKLDVLVLEVGLGGRLDAVNIINPDISVITTIDLDHTEWLGCDRESIAKEKVGIFRAGKPAVCGDVNPPQSIVQKAKELAIPLYCQGIDFGYHIEGENWRLWGIENLKNVLLPMPRLLPQNVATALMAVTLLKEKLPISIEAISKGLINAFLPGRFQVLKQDPRVILDVAHNPEGCRKLAERLKAEEQVAGKTYAVIGMLADKDHEKSLKPLLPCIDKWYVGSLYGERGLAADKLAKILYGIGVSAVGEFTTVFEAYQSALNQATVHDRIVVFGSFFTVSQILSLVWRQPV